MTLILQWSTRTPLVPEFCWRWYDRMKLCPMAHFGLGLDYLAWQAKHGKHSIAVLLDGLNRAGAMILTDDGAGLTCGTPWRCSAVLEDQGSLTPEQGAWFHAAAQGITGNRRLKTYLPSGGSGYRAGRTCVSDLSPSESQLFAALDPDKRRMIRKAEKLYAIQETDSIEHQRAFAMLQLETYARHGITMDVEWFHPPKEGWREWELPWMKLLVAVRDGKVEAGSGFGFYPGSMMDYRANASSLEAKKDGANVLLAWEAMKRAKKLGCQWMNWAGATRFKLEHGATLVELDCLLGGGWGWSLPNAVETVARRARPRLVAWVRKHRSGETGRSIRGETPVEPLRVARTQSRRTH